MNALAKFAPHLLLLAMGCGLVVRAGRLEAGGALIEAKRLARRGGWLSLLGSLVAAVGALALPDAAGAGRFAAAGLLLAAGFAALLAGLSGKPRPTGWAALGLLAAGAAVAVVASISVR
jgi:hypothetical protein